MICWLKIIVLQRVYTLYKHLFFEALPYKKIYLHYSYLYLFVHLCIKTIHNYTDSILRVYYYCSSVINDHSEEVKGKGKEGVKGKEEGVDLYNDHLFFLAEIHMLDTTFLAEEDQYSSLK